ncbi:MAG TPA: ribonuclease HII [Methanomassiliicoccales archaeon]|nr:ribonuclease HII [Methanomassiliicoccales archaeon]
MICGLDEAGRGPVMGPLVVAAVMVEDDRLFREWGVRDSKLHKPEERERLAELIRSHSSWKVVVIGTEEIDERRGSISLNTLEIQAFASLLDDLRPHKAFVDACDVSESNFRRSLMRQMKSQTELVCEHRADQTYPVVSAASIVAKVHRDDAMHRIADELGDVGSGYTSDPKTRAFLEKWIKEKGDLPPYTRRSWATAKQMLGASKISKLSDWE